MVWPVAKMLAAVLARERFTGDDDYVFVGIDGEQFDG